jgi:hypothetical protein
LLSLTFGTDILGETQWRWLETELEKHSAEVDLVVVASGIQVIPVKPRHVSIMSRYLLPRYSNYDRSITGKMGRLPCE